MDKRFLEFERMLKANGYERVKSGSGSSHIKFRNQYGKHISVNIHLNKMVMKRLIKENNLKEI